MKTLSHKFCLLCALLWLPFGLTHAENQQEANRLNNLIQVSQADIFDAKPKEPSGLWQQKISPHVRFDKDSNIFFYQDKQGEHAIVNRVENNEQHQQAVYLGELANQVYLFRQESWQGWKILAISVEQNKRLAFNLAEVFVSADEKSLLVINIPPENCRQVTPTACEFRLTQYAIEINQNLTPYWSGAMTLPHAGFIFEPYWDSQSHLWLQVDSGNPEEFYYLKAGSN